MSGIIFEGADASGKSTLARKVSQASGWPLYLAGGKPKDDEQMWQMIMEQALALHRGDLVDRVSSISQQVYREGLFMRDDLVAEVWKLLGEGHLIVYCRPPMHVLTDPTKHEWKEYDTEEWKRHILTNQVDIVGRYDALMATVPCLIYDWTSEEATHVEALLAEANKPSVRAAIEDMMRRPQQ